MVQIRGENGKFPSDSFANFSFIYCSVILQITGLLEATFHFATKKATNTEREKSLSLKCDGKAQN